MATSIVGIDLGAYRVKVIVANPGFRQPVVTEYIERGVPEGEEPHLLRSARVLAQIVREHQLQEATMYAAVPGDQIFVHVLEFAFRNLRRSELDQAVGAELEGVLPIDLEDMVYSFEELPENVAVLSEDSQVSQISQISRISHTGLQLIDDEPTVIEGWPKQRPTHGQIASSEAGTRVLACAMEQERARTFLSTLTTFGAECRGVIAAPMSYAQVAKRIPRLREGLSSKAATAVIDIGHERTDVCVLSIERPVFARTIARGGKQVTQAVEAAWGLDNDKAELVKHRDGFVASQTMPATSEEWQRIHDVMGPPIAALARDLRQTFQLCLTNTGATIGRALLVGGGARLRGMGHYLTEHLQCHVVTLTEEEQTEILGEAVVLNGDAESACLSAGVAFEGASGSPMFNLRQGVLAYRGQSSFLKGKVKHLVACALAIAIFASGSAYALRNKLLKSDAQLTGLLAVQSRQVLGAEHSAEEILEKIDVGTAKHLSPLPKRTAYDVLLDINERLPAKNAVRLDVEDLEIKAGRVSLKGTTAASEQEGTTPKLDPLDAINEIEKNLKKLDCFREVKPGNVTAGKDETQKFSLTISMECMWPQE